MAEVLGIAGGIVSLTGLGKQIASFYSLCSNLRDAPDDIQHVITELKMLQSMLNTFGVYSQQRENQGYDTEDFKILLLEMSESLRKIGQILKDFTIGIKTKRSLTLGKRVRFLFMKKKIGHQIEVVDRMKAILLAATLNFESLVNEKQHADIQALINALHADLKPVPNDDQSKRSQTADNVVKRTAYRGNDAPREYAEIQPKYEEQIGTALFPMIRTSDQAPSERPTTLQPISMYVSALEEVAENPFHLLVTCIFLITNAKAALPQARKLLQQYPTPEVLAKAHYHDVIPFFKALGLFKRANWLINLAEIWLVEPPQAGKLHTKGKGRSTFSSEVAHLKGVGPVANDAWRIFCKDDLYRRAGHPITIPEWKKVVPTGQELIAYLHSRWEKEGFVWDQRTGDSQKRDAGLLNEDTSA